MKSVLIYPNPNLLVPSSEITDFGPDLNALIDEMADVMHEKGGIGLAAPQIDIRQRIFILSTNPFHSKNEPANSIKAFINPKIIKTEGSGVFSEGCLSFPGVFQIITRPEIVTIEYDNILGETITETYGGIIARIIQHETEHLDGETFLKHLSALKKDIISRKMKKYR